MSHSHSHDGPAHSHSHDHARDQAALDHGHTHEILDGPGSYMGREMPIIEGRDWSERAFTVGIGGYVQSSYCPCTKSIVQRGGVVSRAHTWEFNFDI
jgi:urease accessory protein